MKRKKFYIFFLIMIAGLFGFYKFMTYDRNYNWSKQFEYEITEVSLKIDFKNFKTEKINVENIKLPTERAIKINIQKILNYFNLMNYGKEFGGNISLKSNKTEGLLNCKGWFLSDHLIGLEIEHKNIDESTFKNIKQEFEKKFYNYKIVWTRLTDK